MPARREATFRHSTIHAAQASFLNRNKSVHSSRFFGTATVPISQVEEIDLHYLLNGWDGRNGENKKSAYSVGLVVCANMRYVAATSMSLRGTRAWPVACN